MGVLIIILLIAAGIAWFSIDIYSRCSWESYRNTTIFRYLNDSGLISMKRGYGDSIDEDAAKETLTSISLLSRKENNKLYKTAKEYLSNKVRKRVGL